MILLRLLTLLLRFMTMLKFLFLWFLSVFLLKYLFCSGFPSVRAVWLCDCLSFYCFPVKLKGMLSFHCRICDHSIGYRDGFSKHLRDVLWGDIFNLDACLAHNKFFEFGQVVIKIKSRVFSQALLISMVFSFLYFWLSPSKSFFHIYQQENFVCLRSSFGDYLFMLLKKGLYHLP